MADSDAIRGLVANGRRTWEELVEVLVGGGWNLDRVEEPVTEALDWGLLEEPTLGRFEVVVWST